ncbi:cyclic nucleotide-binding domain-containing protein [Streptomyces olivaceoviridis]|uniref:MarR family transcriptional regulator n=1 Tax=Streptomyces olivaceoviridis TaxID=1921 RepID=UPI0036FBA677
MRNSGNRLVDANGDPVPSAPYAYGGRHSNASQNRMAAIVENPGEFTDAEVRVIAFFLFRSPDHGQPVRRTTNQIAASLGMTRQGYSRIVKRLKERRILIAKETVGRTTFYALTPYLGGHGAGLDQREAIREVNPPELPGMDIKPADVENVVSVASRRRTG